MSEPRRPDLERLYHRYLETENTAWFIRTVADRYLLCTLERLADGGRHVTRRAAIMALGFLGDFNSDGKVDAGDYVTWRKNDGTNNSLANDNGLGIPVGAAHYSLWRANFGNPPGAGSSLSGAQVPEPTTFGLVVVGLLCLVSTHRANRLNCNI